MATQIKGYTINSPLSILRAFLGNSIIKDVVTAHATKPKS
jgi:hypothetical protein